MRSFCRQSGDPFCEGCLVSVPAIYFDIPGTPHEDKWSVATFWEEWNSERCHGTVLKVLSGGQLARMRWHIDRRSQRVGVARNWNKKLRKVDWNLQQREGEFFSAFELLKLQ